MRDSDLLEKDSLLKKTGTIEDSKEPVLYFRFRRDKIFGQLHCLRSVTQIEWPRGTRRASNVVCEGKILNFQHDARPRRTRSVTPERNSGKECGYRVSAPLCTKKPFDNFVSSVSLLIARII